MLPSKPIAMQMLRLSYALRTNLPKRGDNQLAHGWSQKFTGEFDNSAVNLPKRGDCDGPTIQR